MKARYHPEVRLLTFAFVATDSFSAVLALSMAALTSPCAVLASCFATPSPAIKSDTPLSLYSFSLSSRSLSSPGYTGQRFSLTYCLVCLSVEGLYQCLTRVPQVGAHGSWSRVAENTLLKGNKILLFWCWKIGKSFSSDERTMLLFPGSQVAFLQYLLNLIHKKQPSLHYGLPVNKSINTLIAVHLMEYTLQGMNRTRQGSSVERDWQTGSIFLPERFMQGCLHFLYPHTNLFFAAKY